METVKYLTERWWLVLLRGVVSLGLGLAFVLWPGKTIVSTTVFVGALMLIDGIIATIGSFFGTMREGAWWPSFLQGVFGILFGLVVLNWPGVTIGLIVFLVALWALVSGIVTIVMGIASRHEAYGSWVIVLLGLLATGLGLLLMTNLKGTATFFAVVFGVLAIVSGALNIGLGLDLRRLRETA